MARANESRKKMTRRTVRALVDTDFVVLEKLGPKTGCILKCNDPIAPAPHALEMWAQHPSLLSAMENLMLYERWVSRVVLPIAFRWIEEHKDAVYEEIPDNLRDDIGVVIASAFQIVKKLPAEGDGKTTRRLNPVWSRIARKMHIETRSALAAERKLLKETTCLPARK